MPITIDTFSGEIPALHPRLLPPTAAQTAQHTQFDRGTLRPYREPVSVATLAADAQSIIRHGGAWFGFDAVVNAAPGPVAQDRLYLTGDGAPKLYTGSAWRTLALPPPTAVPSVTPAGHAPELDDTSESTVFAYTWVTDLGEESPPSPLSGAFEMHATEGATIGGFDTNFPAGRGVTAYRIYRSVTGLSGGTTLYFIAEHPISSGSYVHDAEADPINEALETADYDTPPDTMKGIISMPNGMMVAYDGREILFCEPFLPHTWPVKYRLKVDYPIMGLAAFGTMLVVVTTGTPYRAEGAHPEEMQLEKIEANLPCVSSRSVVDLGYAAAYATPEGIAMVSPSGAQNITRGVVTHDQYDAMNPSTFVAVSWRGQYLVSHQPVGASARELTMFDFRGEAPYITRGDLEANDLHLDITTGEAYALVGARDIQQIDASATRDDGYVWRSKKFVLPHPRAFSVCRAEGEFGDTPTAWFLMRVFADGDLKLTIDTLNTPERMPGGFTARTWEVEIEGDAEINRVVLAESMGALASV